MTQLEILLLEVLPAFIIGGASGVILGILPLYSRTSRVEQAMTNLEARVNLVIQSHVVQSHGACEEDCGCKH